MKNVHKALHLQHHHHTGKLLAHRHTSYRGLAVVLVLATAFIVGLNAMARATADSLFVDARIPAPIPTTAAVITNPLDNTVIHTGAVTVSGNCPVITPNVIIALVDNGTEIGSVACASDHTFQIDVVLAHGTHTLIARTYTITGDTGPDSAPVHVTYPAPPTATGGSPLTLTIDVPFIVFGPQKDAVWIGSIEGGSEPYYVLVSWGDGQTSKYTVRAGQEQFSHHYKTMQPYDITFTVRDSSGTVITRHYAAVTPYVAPSTTIFSTTERPWAGGTNLFGIYGVYLMLLAGFGLLWVRAHPFAYAKVPAHRPVRRPAARRHTQGRH